MPNPNVKDTSPAVDATVTPVDTAPGDYTFYLWVYATDGRAPEAVAFLTEEAARNLPPEPRGKRSFRRGLYKVTVPVTNMLELLK